MTRKHGVLAALAMLAVPLVVAATALACGSLATLKLNRATAAAGDQVQARGGNFNTSPRASTVQLRFNSRNGRVLWEGRPGPNGRFTATFAMPAARRGYYVVLATQTGPDGRPAAGTPGRAPIRLRRRATSSASAAPASPWAPPAGGSPSGPGGGLSLVTVVPGGLGLLALVGGLLGLRRAARRRRIDVARPVA